MKWTVVVTALLLAACGNDPTSPEDQALPAGATTLAAAALTFYQVSGGGEHTCAVDDRQRGLVLGYNASGQLGAGGTSVSASGRGLPFYLRRLLSRQ